VRTLRTSVGENESLGTAIGSLARHLSSGSGVPIQVTLDESTQRLRPDVEAELLRITQEAMNNAGPALRGHPHRGPVHGGAAPGRDHRRRRRPGHPRPSRGLARAGDHGRARPARRGAFTVERREPAEPSSRSSSRAHPSTGTRPPIGRHPSPQPLRPASGRVLQP
jgi:hypothetical protein